MSFIGNSPIHKADSLSNVTRSDSNKNILGNSISRMPDESAERKRFAEYLNTTLNLAETRPDLLINVDSETSLFEVVSDGIILNRFVNTFYPGKVNEAKLVTNPKSTFEKTANNEQTVAALKNLNIKLVNIEANDITNKSITLILGVLWQLIKKSLLSKLDDAPMLDQLRIQLESQNENPTSTPGEDFTPEKALFSWFNWHLKRSGRTQKVLKNFGVDTEDSEIYAIILNKIAPDHMTEEKLDELLATQDKTKRAVIITEVAKVALGARNSIFVTPKEIISGNNRLNFAFGLTLFNFSPTLEERSRSQPETPRSEEASLGKSDVKTVWITGPSGQRKTKGSISWLPNGVLTITAKQVIFHLQIIAKNSRSFFV